MRPKYDVTQATKHITSLSLAVAGEGEGGHDYHRSLQITPSIEILSTTLEVRHNKQNTVTSILAWLHVAAASNSSVTSALCLRRRPVRDVCDAREFTTNINTVDATTYR